MASLAPSPVVSWSAQPPPSGIFAASTWDVFSVLVKRRVPENELLPLTGMCWGPKTWATSCQSASPLLLRCRCLFCKVDPKLIKSLVPARQVKPPVRGHHPSEGGRAWKFTFNDHLDAGVNILCIFENILMQGWIFLTSSPWFLSSVAVPDARVKFHNVTYMY